MRQRTSAEWEELVREYRSSGKSLREWCEENEINYKTMSGHTYLVPSRSSQRSDKKWIDLINEQRSSGMSRGGWCRERGINPKSMESAEKRINMKINSDNSSSEKQLFANVSVNMQEHDSTNENNQMNNVSELRSDFVEPKWIEVNIGEPPKSELSPKTSHLPANILATDSFDDAEKNEEKKPQSVKLSDSKIMIRCGKLTIEADAGYPAEHLENLIGKLAMVC